ncbi:2-amino-4-hydroxy-6-hydroxymethyldihydropteridinediphosphokinase [Alkalispirochaeta americana]|uniref:2-amino-4-hydroxy-6-hydroxymethyldihydropteridine pyrophosphokinase n=1 Tax=Alkalispirochaeta americana TaxID=159291 RepID=A0A1N6P794_9SPIO|nr:2-amino-4-hydroxy-6-hydroxymethyldihydropteridine diphosphokinase [Alkalispirochaeta americana]SIQ00169.1 2-amino-4-hydroxy-6-hydroxymethyldihydropteridinediphosphokinase [Alkalispirochaeta americana]
MNCSDSRDDSRVTGWLVLLGLGANTPGPWGGPEETLAWAVSKLTGLLREVSCSSVHYTAPLHYSDQPHYFNQVLRGVSRIGPHGLLYTLRDLEKQAGRCRIGVQRFGPRSLDLDILTFGDYTISSADLQVPHPRMHERRFVLEPLREVAPRARDPRNGAPWASYLPKAS